MERRAKSSNSSSENKSDDNSSGGFWSYLLAAGAGALIGAAAAGLLTSTETENAAPSAGRMGNNSESDLQPEKPTTCCVCLDNDKCILFKPCQHVCACQECAKTLDKCPMCRKVITEKTKVYI